MKVCQSFYAQALKLRAAARLVWTFFAVWRQSPCGDRGTDRGTARPVPTASHIYSGQTHRLFAAFARGKNGKYAQPEMRGRAREFQIMTLLRIIILEMFPKVPNKNSARKDAFCKEKGCQKPRC